MVVARLRRHDLPRTLLFGWQRLLCLRGCLVLHHTSVADHLDVPISRGACRSHEYVELAYWLCCCYRVSHFRCRHLCLMSTVGGPVGAAAVTATYAAEEEPQYASSNAYVSEEGMDF